MTADTSSPIAFANPRPGLVKTLGILNITFASLILVYILMLGFWLAAMIVMSPNMAPVPVATDGPPSMTTTSTSVFMVGMDDSRFIRFTIIDATTGLALNLIMLFSGIGLLNLGRRSSRWWLWAAWIKIVRLPMLWGYFIVEVAPMLSEKMAQAALSTFRGAPGRAPSMAQFTQIYNYANLIMALLIVLIGVIYPAISLWILGRPGFQAALLPRASKEPEQP